MRAFALSCAAVGIAYAPSSAHACSPPPCWPGYFTPGEGASVPANLPGIQWHPMRDNGGALMSDPTMVVLTTQAAPQTPIPLTATMTSDGAYLLVPTVPLSPGETYVLVDHTVCPIPGTDAPHATFRTGVAVPLPTGLGTLAATPELGPLTVGTPSGSCSAEVTAASAEVSIVATSDALPWADILLYQTVVDGRPWFADHSIREDTAPGTSWEGRGIDRVYHVCQSSDPDANPGVAEGTHEVAMQATLAGSSAMLAADPITIDLDCQHAPGSGSDGQASSPAGCNASGAPTGLPLLGALVLIYGRFARRRRLL